MNRDDGAMGTAFLTQYRAFSVYFFLCQFLALNVVSLSACTFVNTEDEDNKTKKNNTRRREAGNHSAGSNDMKAIFHVEPHGRTDGRRRGCRFEDGMLYIDDFGLGAGSEFT